MVLFSYFLWTFFCRNFCSCTSDTLHAGDDKLSLLMSSVLFNLYIQEAIEDHADFGRDR